MALENTNAPVSTDPLIGRVLDGKFRIIELIGSGGMSRIYRAEQIGIERFVAVKIVKPLDGLARGHRIFREAQALSSLKHKNVVEIFSLGDYEGEPYIAMELIDGMELSAHAKNGPLELPQFLHIFTQVAAALSAIHAKGLIHRDVTPKNIMLINNGRDFDVRLVDFGIVKFTGREIQQLTMSGALIGTLHYMSPEQSSRDEIDCLADVYSLGCVMYETLNGKPPFAGDSPYAVLLAHANDEPAALSPDLPAWLRALIRAMMQKTAVDRINIDEVHRCLTQRVAPDMVHTPTARHKSTSNRFGVGASLLLMALGCCIAVSLLVWFIQSKSAADSMPGVVAALKEKLSDLDVAQRDFHRQRVDGTLHHLREVTQRAHENLFDLVGDPIEERQPSTLIAFLEFERIMIAAIKDVKPARLNKADTYSVVDMTAHSAEYLTSRMLGLKRYREALHYARIAAGQRHFLARRIGPDNEQNDKCADDFHTVAAILRLLNDPVGAASANREGVYFCNEHNVKGASSLAMLMELCPLGASDRADRVRFIKSAVPILKQDFKASAMPVVLTAARTLVQAQLLEREPVAALETSNRAVELTAQLPHDALGISIGIRVLMQNVQLLTEFGQTSRAFQVYDKARQLAGESDDEKLKQQVTDLRMKLGTNSMKPTKRSGSL